MTTIGVSAQEVLKNNAFTQWEQAAPDGWIGGEKELAILPDGIDVAAKVKGNEGQMVQRIKLEKGAYYLIGGQINKGGGQAKAKGRIGIRDGKYTWKAFGEGSDQVSEWTKVGKVYQADGTEAYFYCFNWYLGQDGVCYYAGLSLKKITPEEAKKLEDAK